MKPTPEMVKRAKAYDTITHTLDGEKVVVILRFGNIKFVAGDSLIAAKELASEINKFLDSAKADAVAKERERIIAVMFSMMERLAEIEHARWSRWYQHAVGRWTEKNVERWNDLAEKPYSELSEELKESDRKEVRAYLSEIVQAIRSDGK